MSIELSKTAYELVKSRLPETDAKTIQEYIYDVNEWGLGMETLVDSLLEEDIPVTKEQKRAILKAMSSMNLDRSQETLRIEK